MKKKISTLLVAALALVWSVSAFAQVVPGSPVPYLQQGQNQDLFQIVYTSGGTNYALGMTSTGALELVALPLTSSNGLANTLWCVSVEPDEQGANPRFDFLNKGEGLFLALDLGEVIDMDPSVSQPVAVADSVYAGADVKGWAFSKTFTNVQGLEVNKPLYSYFRNDSVVGFVITGGEVRIQKEAAGILDSGSIPFDDFTLYYANTIVLEANEFNTIFNTQSQNAGVNLTFAPDVAGDGAVLGNPFNNTPIYAAQSNNPDYLYVYKANKQFLYVDTAYTNVVGNSKFLGYNWRNLSAETSINNAVNTLDTDNYSGQYQFKMTYSPSNDSLIIQVYQVIQNYSETNDWSSFLGSSTIEYPTSTQTPKFEGIWQDYYVSLQELIKGSTRILTVEQSQNTRISFGYGGCAETPSDKATLEGVYIITDTKGHYLAAPLYLDGGRQGAGTFGRGVEWVEVNLNDQEPQHMPAYQWVIVKNRDTETSTVSMYNREYAWDGTSNVTQFTSIQLYKNDGAKYYTIPGYSFGVDSLEFIAVEKENLGNPYLGYKHIPTDSLFVSSYQFKYFNPFTDEQYLGKGTGSDSTLYAKNVLSAFSLGNSNVGRSNFNYDPTYTYGYQASKSIQDKFGIVETLERTPYYITLKDYGWYVHAENDERYAIGAQANVNDTIYVYFKENNHYNGNHYYAFIEAETSTPGTYYRDELGTLKAGISDGTLSAPSKIESLGEKGTSTFTVEPDMTPLYRRFNSADEGVSKDTTVILEFYEHIRGEMLQIEGNKNVNPNPGKIDFLGIYDRDKAPSGLSFIVDTAWVNRGLGNIKPQYLISIERDDFKGQAADSCKLDHDHLDGITAWTCPHATKAIPAFNRGKYLVNFAHIYGSDSAVWGKNNEYMWAEYYNRAGFLHAIHITDTLIVLNPEVAAYYFKTIDNTKVDLNAIKNDSRNYIVDLKYDNHKYVTWSMRYVDPDKALVEEGKKQFLFESMKKKDNYDIAPDSAAWLKMNNGVLVLSHPDLSSFENMRTGGDDALIFDVNIGKASDVATDNEQAPSVAGVVVVAGNGEVTIKNANGKKVAISNVLGQTVANTVLTSDNATIAAPQGVVVVAVEGEKAVKAVVK